MPFITKERRKMLETQTPLDFQPGDRCYVYYKEMIQKWRANPRWTTAHEIYKDLLTSNPLGYDNVVARELAWQVFFQLEVMPYEKQKQVENGDVE